MKHTKLGRRIVIVVYTVFFICVGGPVFFGIGEALWPGSKMHREPTPAWCARWILRSRAEFSADSAASTDPAILASCRRHPGLQESLDALTKLRDRKRTQDAASAAARAQDAALLSSVERWARSAP